MTCIRFEGHTIDGRGYALAWEARDEISRIIEPFLARHPIVPGPDAHPSRTPAFP